MEQNDLCPFCGGTITKFLKEEKPFLICNQCYTSFENQTQPIENIFSQRFVKEAKWERFDYDTFICSNCHTFTDDPYYANFCPQCGATMSYE